MPEQRDLAAVQLPKWQCHKQVWGDRIREILPLTPDSERAGPEDTGRRWYLACGGVIVETQSLIARQSPDVGDYYVQYEDGYQSWSPAAAFEAGYTRL